MTGPPVIGLGGWAFLAFAGVVLPLAVALFAAAERRREDASSSADLAHGDADIPSRVPLYAHALMTHAILLGAAVATARVEGVVLFPRVTVDGRDMLAAALALGAVLVVGELSWRSRSPQERERLWVRRILPHTPTERRAWIVVAAGAALAEEVAYRGVFVAFAAAATGSLLVAVIASAIAFAVVHAPQGAAGIGYVFVIALVHQALVSVTGTLVPAIAVHCAYDVLAGLWLAPRHGLTS